MLNIARRLWPESKPVPASVPRGVRVYAVGDIHGRLDLLDQLLGQIQRDAALAPDRVNYLVFLGDYVDRGPHSSLVIERLATCPLPGFGSVYLRGNHEATMMGFLRDIRVGPDWLAYGGTATLASYGVPPPCEDAPPTFMAEAQRQLNAALPAHHRSFLAGLRTSLSIGDYHFVHAGVRPGVPLDRQSDDDRLWIRREFLESRADHGKVVVHGHTIAPEPDIRANRIGIDTGAFATNRLTCLILDGTDRRFLCTV